MDELTEHKNFRSTKRINMALNILLTHSLKEHDCESTVIRASLITEYNKEAKENGWTTFKDLGS